MPQNRDETSAWVHRALRGDVAAEERLAGRAYTAGLRLATFSLGDRFQAEEVGQEVAIRVLRALPKLRDPERFDAWTYRICASEIKRSAKKRGRHEWQPLDAAELRDESDFPEALGERDWLSRSLRQLSDRQRIVLALRFVCGLTDKEIAEAIRSRPGTVRSLSSRALKQLREQSEHEQVDAEAASNRSATKRSRVDPIGG